MAYPPPYATAPNTPQRSGWTIAAALLVTLAVVIAGIIGVGAYVYLNRPRPGTSTTANPPADGGSYASAAALIAALGAGGVACTGYDAVANPTGGAISRGSCSVAGAEVVVSIYGSEADALAQPGRLAGLGALDMVIGRNWTLNVDTAALAQRLAGAIGGRLVHVPA